MSIATKQRIFVVGCPRSGTTLLQSLLAAHSDVASFPESHLFSSLVADRGKLRSTFNIASRKARPQFDTFLRELQREDLNQYLPKFSFLVRQYSHAFIRILDILSEEQGKDIWIEKTPRHLHCIDQIEKLLPEPQFIHIIRSGKDVVASLYDVTHKYPEIWNGARDINTCIQRWKDDVLISLDCMEKSNHYLVKYEDLVENTRLVLEDLCHFIDIPFQEKMLYLYGESASKVSLKSEKWKDSVGGKIENSGSHKFYQLFEDSQREYIQEELSAITLKLNRINFLDQN